MRALRFDPTQSSNLCCGVLFVMFFFSIFCQGSKQGRVSHHTSPMRTGTFSRTRPPFLPPDPRISISPQSSRIRCLYENLTRMGWGERRGREGGKGSTVACTRGVVWNKSSLDCFEFRFEGRAIQTQGPCCRLSGMSGVTLGAGCDRESASLAGQGLLHRTFR
jgi:hypothetical protein